MGGLGPLGQIAAGVALAALIALSGRSLGLAFRVSGAVTDLLDKSHGLAAFIRDPVGAVRSYVSNTTPLGAIAGVAESLLTFAPGKFAGAAAGPYSRQAMSMKEARAYANKQARDYRKARGINQGGTVQAGHTAAARHATQSGISKQDWDKQPMQELYSRKGKGLDVTVTDQDGQKKVTTQHRSQEGLIDDAVERSKACGKLSPEGQLDAAAEVKWRTNNVPMDQRNVDAVRKGGPALPEKGPPVDPHSGKVISKKAK